MKIIGRLAGVLLFGLLFAGSIVHGQVVTPGAAPHLSLRILAMPQVGIGGAPPPSTGTQHQVALSWTQSATQPAGVTIVGSNIYRGTIAGGPYGKINVTPVTGTSFTDTAANAGTTERYVVTAVSSAGNESAWSNEASGTVPSNPNPHTALAVTAQ